ncbi:MULTISPECIES: DUF4350 domain-containing protein [Nostocales]|uniref:DUF4350 domain-containing protein n=3 Tax=Nostocales TaxID=1161 RepID=A0A0C1NET3_9CYAN|nr:DUF4350 domain-containing protein [Tolypothrix bouteillei]KAF3887370.1 DUF4350 domain-containing protein [Tolypothrix bouteillei VB521301]
MKRSNRLVWIGALVLCVLVLLTVISAPTTSKHHSGSTYSLYPEGYGAWYAYMESRGTRIQRWQKPFEDLKLEKRPITFVQINGYQRQLSSYDYEREWVEKGNRLIIVGVSEPVTAAKFTTMQESPAGQVKIDTRRRHPLRKGEKVSLGDRFGAIVWEEKYGKGTAIFVIPSYLGANAYQENQANFQYLADLVTQKDNLLFVDEYIHGYKEPSVRKQEGKGDIWSYLAQTPLMPAFVQGGVLLVVLIWGQNRRFGKPVSLETPVVDNSEAYIQALAGVLQKAESRDFVVEMVGKEEQLQLQKSLGLGQQLLDRPSLVNTWVQQTGVAATELDEVLNLQSQKRRLSEKELISWLEKWRIIRQKI